MTHITQIVPHAGGSMTLRVIGYLIQRDFAVIALPRRYLHLLIYTVEDSHALSQTIFVTYFSYDYHITTLLQLPLLIVCDPVLRHFRLINYQLPM